MKIAGIIGTILIIFLILCSCSDPGVWGLIELQDRMDAYDYSSIPSLIPISEPTQYIEPTLIPTPESTIEPPEPTLPPESPTQDPTEDPTQVPGTPAPSSGPIDQLVVYDDSLNGWADASSGCTPDYNNTFPVYERTKSIGFDMTEADCTLSFVKEPGTVDLDQYSAISFHIHGGGTGGQSIALYLCDQDDVMIGGMVTLDDFIDGGQIQPDSWQHVEIPLPALGVMSGFCGYIHILNNTAGVQPVVYLDSIEFFDSIPFFPPGPSPTGDPTFPSFPTNTAGPTGLPFPTPGM